MKTISLIFFFLALVQIGCSNKSENFTEIHIESYFVEGVLTVSIGNKGSQSICFLETDQNSIEIYDSNSDLLDMPTVNYGEKIGNEIVLEAGEVYSQKLNFDNLTGVAGLPQKGNYFGKISFFECKDLESNGVNYFDNRTSRFLGNIEFNGAYN